MPYCCTLFSSTRRSMKRGLRYSRLLRSVEMSCFPERACCCSSRSMRACREGLQGSPGGGGMPGVASLSAGSCGRSGASAWGPAAAQQWCCCACDTQQQRSSRMATPVDCKALGFVMQAVNPSPHKVAAALGVGICCAPGTWSALSTPAPAAGRASNSGAPLSCASCSAAPRDA